MEQVVAGVWVAIERMHAVEAAEHKTEEDLADAVLLVLRPRQHLVPRAAVHQFARDHVSAAEGVQHVGHVDERVPAIEVGEQLLVASLQPVVQLFCQAFLDLCNHVVGVEATEALLQHDAQQVGVAEVGCHGFAHAGVLHLHCYCTFLPGRRVDDDGAMHLADAGGSDGLRIPLDEQLLGRRTQVLLDHLSGQSSTHRRGVRLQLRQRFPHRTRERLVDVAGHLTELHQSTLHVAQAFGNGLGGPQLARLVELDPAFGVGEQLARGGARIVGAHSDTQLGHLGVALPAAGAQVGLGPGSSDDDCDDRKSRDHGGRAPAAIHRVSCAAERSTTEPTARSNVGMKRSGLATTES